MSTFQTEGIWGHIVCRANVVELSEIARIIGLKCLQENSALWEELKAFNSILSDIANSELLERVDETIFHGGKKDSSESGVGWRALTEDALREQKKTVPALDLASSAILNNNLTHGSNNSTSRRGSQLSGRSTTSLDSLEFVQSIESHINVASIHSVVDDIRKALSNERAELESEITVLRQAMDGESDIISARSSSARTNPGASRMGATAEKDKVSQNDCKDKKSKMSRFQKLDRLGVGESDICQRKEQKNISATSYDCKECARVNRDLESVGKMRPNKLSASTSLSSLGMSRQEYVNALTNKYDESNDDFADRIKNSNTRAIFCGRCLESKSKELDEKAVNDDKDPTGIAMRGSKSRMRNKLQAARDEKHFLDFDV